MLLTLLSLAGCSGPASASSASTGRPAAAGEAAPAAAVRLWQDAGIFTLVGHAIGSAHGRALVEMYELGRDEIAAELGAARARGVDVRVITDPTVTASRREASRLDSIGVPERVYPVDDARHQIDHVKLLIVDDEAIVGGMNWGRHSDRNHDYVLETRRPGDVGRAVRVFEQDWALSGGRPSPSPFAGTMVAQTSPGNAIRSMLEAALNHATRRVLAEVYTLTDGAVLADLALAHRRGADVRVVLDPNQAYNRRSADLLRRAGVPVRWYPVPAGALLHAKIGLFDGALVLGSANWTWSGLEVNHELDIETEDPHAVAAYGSRFESDWARSSG